MSLCVIYSAYAYDFSANNSQGQTFFFNTLSSTTCELTYKSYETKRINYMDVDVYSSYLPSETILPSTVTYHGKELEVVQIAANAFQDNKECKYIYIPSSIKRIYKDAFANCTNISRVETESIEAWCNMFFSNQKSNPLYYSDSLLLNGKLMTDIIVPEGIKSLAWNFSWYSNLKSVELPNSLIKIGGHTFEQCKNLSFVNIPNNVEEIGASAFKECSGLSTVIFGNSVNKIDDYAFYGCSGISTLDIPNSTTKIGDYVFLKMTKLSNVTLGTGIQSIGNYAFDNISDSKELYDFYCYAPTPPSTYNSNGSSSFRKTTNGVIPMTLYVPKGTKDIYSRTGQWALFWEIKEMDVAESCAKPQILYSQGHLSFNSETVGAKFHYSITDNDIKSGVVAEGVDLNVSYNVSVYATADGFADSEIATATLCWIDFTPKGDGVESISTVKAVPVLFKTDGNTIIIEAPEDIGNIEFYSIDGKYLGLSYVDDGCASFTTVEHMVIIKLRDKTIKLRK